MYDFEITKARCVYSTRAGCQHPRSLSGKCIAIDCKLTDKQIDELILGHDARFIPYIELI